MYDRPARSCFVQNKHNLTPKTLEKAIHLLSNDPELRDYLQNRRDFVLRAAQGTAQRRIGAFVPTVVENR